MKNLEVVTNIEEEEKLFADHGLDASHFGRPETLRFNVLTYTAQENFDRALRVLEDFMKAEYPYPQFKSRVIRYIQHARDIINAIKTKRNFPGISSLTRAKQQELREKYREHFRELVFILTRVEKVQADLRLNDAKATAWVVKALYYSCVVLFVTSVVLGLVGGTAKSIELLVDDNLTRMLNSVF